MPGARDFVMKWGAGDHDRNGNDPLAYSLKVRNLFDSSIVAYWPLWEKSGSVAEDIVNGHNAQYMSVSLNQQGIGDGNGAPYFDGVNSCVAIYSTGLANAFNGDECSVLMFASVDNWTDGALRSIFRLRQDSNNFAYVIKSSAPNQITFSRRATASPNEPHIDLTGVSESGYAALGFSWSLSSSIGRAFYRDSQVGSDSLCTKSWVGGLTSSDTVIGANSLTPIAVHKGGIAHFVILNRLISVPEFVEFSKTK